MKLFSCVSFITLQILGFFHQLVLILIFYGVTVKTKNCMAVVAPRGGGVLPYITYIGMCRCEGYGFQAV